jgi:mannosidase alpha-like ER degradation enhancer 3
MLEHSFGSYMQHAYPLDELKPLSCAGRRWDQRERGNLDDSLGGFSLTLIDSLDSFAVAGDLSGLRCAVSRFIHNVGFANRSVVVSVFETVIRVIGGLLSAHILSVDERLGIWREACLPRGSIDDNSRDCSQSCGRDTSSIYSCDVSLCLQKYNG